MMLNPAAAAVSATCSRLSVFFGRLLLNARRTLRSRFFSERESNKTLQLGAILEAVSKVSELDLSDVPPTSHPLSLVNAWRDDEPHESLGLDEVFANAPNREDDLFRVPPTT